jgi:geranylgeranyl pyrophosphate synthase
METVMDFIDRRGQSALQEAQLNILRSNDESAVSEALTYYAKEVFPQVLPIFPALIHLSCEMVGGNPEDTKPVAAAMLLITASGDIHDDIIDRSTKKSGKKTMFGKYGKDITLLAGDALLLQGMGSLQNSTLKLAESKRSSLTNLITKAMFELTAAEATETCLWKKPTVSLDEYFEVIKQKGSIAELHCKIGGLLGNASAEAFGNLERYGRAIGILSVMKDEFMDVASYSELKYRFRNELLPFPVVYAFQNESIKEKVLSLLEGDFQEKDVAAINTAVFGSVEIKQLKKSIKAIGEQELSSNPLLIGHKERKEAGILLQFLST